MDVPRLNLAFRIISYVNYSTVEAYDASSSSSTDSTSARIRAEAANIVASLAHGEALSSAVLPPIASKDTNNFRFLGPREVLFALLTEDAPSAILNALASLSEHDPIFLKVAVVRALRALCVAIADCAGPSLWGLGDECLELRSETRSMLDYIFQVRHSLMLQLSSIILTILRRKLSMFTCLFSRVHHLK